jgi:hypothetical protein
MCFRKFRKSFLKKLELEAEVLNLDQTTTDNFVFSFYERKTADVNVKALLVHWPICSQFIDFPFDSFSLACRFCHCPYYVQEEKPVVWRYFSEICDNTLSPMNSRCLDGIEKSSLKWSLCSKSFARTPDTPIIFLHYLESSSVSDEINGKYFAVWCTFALLSQAWKQLTSLFAVNKKCKSQNPSCDN